MTTHIDIISANGAATPIKLLLIEDCMGDVFLLTKMLEAHPGQGGFSIQAVSRLTEAMHILEKERFDVLLLDLNIVDMDGISSVAALHAQFPAIPIVVYSGSDDYGLQRKAMQCGASHYLVKGLNSGGDISHSLEYAVAQA